LDKIYRFDFSQFDSSHWLLLNIWNSAWVLVLKRRCLH